MTEFLYDGSRLVAEYAGSGSTLRRRYAHGPGVDEPLVWWEGTGTADRRFLHHDRQGSVIAWTNGSGAVGETYSYGPYGEPARSGGADPWGGSRFRYTGQIMLPEARLYHYKARVYDPGLGRFLQTDPIGYRDDMNLYAYVKGDPVNMIDPSGRDAVVLNGPIAESNGKAHHQGLLIGNDEDGWTYYSKDGAVGGGPAGESHWKVIVFRGPLSEVLKDEEFRRYDSAVLFRAGPKQDARMRQAAERAASERYNAIFNNCGDLVSRALRAAGIMYPQTINPADAPRQAGPLFTRAIHILLPPRAEQTGRDARIGEKGVDAQGKSYETGSRIPRRE